MIAPIVLAIAFWAPYTAGDPVCPNGVQVRDAPVPADIVAQMGPDEVPAAWTELGSRDCKIWTNGKVFRPMGLAYQCEILAHELGHNWLGRQAAAETDEHGHSHDGGLMEASTSDTTPPGACFQPAPAKSAVHIGTALRVSRVCRHHGKHRRCFYRQTFSSGATS